MCRTHTIIYVVTMITGFFCCCIIVASQSISEDKPEEENITEDAESAIKDKLSATGAEATIKNKLSTAKAQSLFSTLKDKFPIFTKLDTWTQSNDENERAFDFSITGDKVTKNISFSTTLPINSFGGYFRGQSLLIRHNGVNISQSYMFQLEGDIPYKLFNHVTPRGHFEIENDPIIETDPHLHISLYDDFILWDKWRWLRGGLGFWGEVVSKYPEMPADLEHAEYDKFRGGFRGHLDLKGKRGFVSFDMEIEYLQHLRFDRFEYSIRTSPEIKIEIFDDISLIIIGEIDYYYIEKGLLTIEPWVDIFKPLDTSWTHLWSIEF